MACPRQRVTSRRGMQQRIETFTDDTQNTHVTRASALFVVKDAPERPLIFRPPCQSEIKRTLRHQSRPAMTVLWRGFRKPRNIHSAGMVNAGFPTPSRYGFEMVHAPAAPVLRRESSSMENLRRIKSRVFSFLFKRQWPWYWRIKENDVYCLAREFDIPIQQAADEINWMDGNVDAVRRLRYRFVHPYLVKFVYG